MRLILCFLYLISFSVFAQSEINILFVGNSLTYTNNLPELVEKSAANRGAIVKTGMLAYPNYAMEDHWNDGEVQKLIRSGKYQYVVVQQGPSSQEEGRRMLHESGALMRELCEENQCKLVYFMVWPSRTYYDTFDRVITNHYAAAAANNALVCPVGEVWKSHFDSTGDFSYYGIDGFHPSQLGSQVAAEVIVNSLLKD